MKSKVFSVLLCFVAITLLLTSIPCYALDQKEDAADEAQSILSGILAHQNTGKIQDWIDGYLSETPSGGTEWYVLSLAQYGDYNFSSYQRSLLAYLKENQVRSASSRLKFALCLAAVGSDDEYIANALESSIGEQGLMSWVFGLHLINNKIPCSEYTAEAVIAKLLSLQCGDGGWAISGAYGDADSTAMTVQALAPYYETDEEVKSAIEKALQLLSEKQLEDGDYASYGVPNPESTAQVLITLSALGIDAATDARFIKNGNRLFDGIEKYRLSDGSFSHKAGEGSNGNATIQAFCGMVAYLRFAEGKSPLYWLDSVYAFENEDEAPATDTAESDHAASAPEDGALQTQETTEDAAGLGDSGKTGASFAGYKPWVSLVIAGIGGIACVLLVLLKKRHIHNFVAAVLVCAAAITIVYVTDVRSADDYYNGNEGTKENAIGTVTLTIRCDDVAGRAEHIPENGIILDVTEFEIAEGDTVYTVLTEAARKHRIQLENDGGSSLVYISGINYLYEFDYGDLSGWVYEVNGERLSVGAGEYRLKDGDVIAWYYTTNIGTDLK